MAISSGLMVREVNGPWTIGGSLPLQLAGVDQKHRRRNWIWFGMGFLPKRDKP